MRYFLQLAGQDHEVAVVTQAPSGEAPGVQVHDQDGSRVASITGSAGAYRVLIDGRVVDLTLSDVAGAGPTRRLEVRAFGVTHSLSIVSERDRPRVANSSQSANARRSITAQMPGRIVQMRVQAGDQVQKGQALLVMEAMKMENELYADDALRVVAVNVQVGDAVEMGAPLLVVEC